MIHETFIEVAEDCPAVRAEIPPARDSRPTKAAIGYELIAGEPYALLVAGARRHVVGRIGMEQSSEQLDLPAAHAQLGHATAIHRPMVPCTACVDVEQLAQAADARGLDVDHARGERRRADVVGASDRRVVGQALEAIAEPLSDLGQVVGVLQIGVRKGRENAVVERTERLGILDLEAVLALEVDRVDRPGCRELAKSAAPRATPAAQATA
jgi:hypothetical protein